MAITRLGLYNIAVLALGERTIDSLTEDREERYALDEVWTRGNGAVDYFLEQGYWNFAMRSIQLDHDASVTVQFGYSWAFQKPDDWIKLNMISSGETFGQPLTDYEMEQDYIYANVDPLYLRYVSNGAEFGNDFSLWPETFSLWAGHWMALQIAPKILNNNDYKELMKIVQKLLVDARSKDASEEPPRFPPLSSWASARHNRFGRRDRGSRSSLIG